MPDWVDSQERDFNPFLGKVHRSRHNTTGWTVPKDPLHPYSAIAPAPNTRAYDTAAAASLGGLAEGYRHQWPSTALTSRYLYETEAPFGAHDKRRNWTMPTHYTVFESTTYSEAGVSSRFDIEDYYMYPPLDALHDTLTPSTPNDACLANSSVYPFESLRVYDLENAKCDDSTYCLKDFSSKYPNIGRCNIYMANKQDACWQYPKHGMRWPPPLLNVTNATSGASSLVPEDDVAIGVNGSHKSMTFDEFDDVALMQAASWSAFDLVDRQQGLYRNNTLFGDMVDGKTALDLVNPTAYVTGAPGLVNTVKSVGVIGHSDSVETCSQFSDVGAECWKDRVVRGLKPCAAVLYEGDYDERKPVCWRQAENDTAVRFELLRPADRPVYTVSHDVHGLNDSLLMA